MCNFLFNFGTEDKQKKLIKTDKLDIQENQNPTSYCTVVLYNCYSFCSIYKALIFSRP